jgi:hypothetical protein
MARFGQQVVQGLINPSFGQGLFDLGSAIGSAPRRAREEEERKAKEEQLRSIMQLGTAAVGTQDPTNLSRAAQQLSQIPGMEQQALAFAQMAQKAGAAMAQKEAFVQSKEQLATTAAGLELHDLAKEIRLAPDQETLKPIREKLIDEQIKRLPASPAKNSRRLQGAGLNPQDYDVRTLTDDDVTNIINGQVDADVEAWTNEAGDIVSVAVSSSGKVKTRDTGDKWVLPYEAGLVRPAPEVSKVLQQSERFIEALGDESIKDLVDLRDKAEAAQDKLAIIDRQLVRIGGMPTGLAANVELGLRRVAEFFGLGYDPKVTNAQEFMMEVANLVKTEIKAFGSGTSITDADREYTQNMVGGDITSQAQALENMLNIYRRAAVESINNYNTVRGKTAKSYGEENMGTFVPMDVPPYNEFAGFSIGEQ